MRPAVNRLVDIILCGDAEGGVLGIVGRHRHVHYLTPVLIKAGRPPGIAAVGGLHQLPPCILYSGKQGVAVRGGGYRSDIGARHCPVVAVSAHLGQFKRGELQVA
ncbi:hypothetical protein ES703_117324 [subsurface metagenome]